MADPDASPSGARNGSEPIDLLTYIVHTRRTSLVVDAGAPVPDDLVDRLVDLAIWAPNHKRSWPWRFAVFTGDGRRRLGEAMAAVGEKAGLSHKKVDKMRVKYLRSPVVVVVSSVADKDPHRRAENRDAVAAAVQNMLLGATALGLASHWASIDDVVAPAVRSVAGTGPADDLVALVYL
ncbi:MAG: nitroreductase, partial [Actinomycetota bacterium]|nr:nitroreductase [Actinomycetota bacterium]